MRAIRLGLERLIPKPLIQRVRPWIVDGIDGQEEVAISSGDDEVLHRAQKCGAVPATTVPLVHRKVHNLWHVARVASVRPGGRATQHQAGNADRLLIEHQHEIAKPWLARIAQPIPMHHFAVGPLDGGQRGQIGMADIAHGNLGCCRIHGGECVRRSAQRTAGSWSAYDCRWERTWLSS